MEEPGKGQCFRSDPSARTVRRLDDEDIEAVKSQYRGRREPVGAGADDDRVAA